MKRKDLNVPNIVLTALVVIVSLSVIGIVATVLRNPGGTIFDDGTIHRTNGMFLIDTLDGGFYTQSYRLADNGAITFVNLGDKSKYTINGYYMIEEIPQWPPNDPGTPTLTPKAQEMLDDE